MTAEIELNAQELRLAEASYSTAAPLEMVAHYIKFPKDFYGKKMLDIGAGASTATLELRERGVEAYAVDFRYQNLGGLRCSFEDWLTKPGVSTKVPSRKQMATDMEKERQKLLRSIPRGTPPHLREQVTKMASAYFGETQLDNMMQQLKIIVEKNRIYTSLNKNSINRFLDCVRSGDSYYIAAIAGNLPFQDGSFDFVYSLLAISFFLSHNPEVFTKSVQEAYRVVKPGGEMQVHLISRTESPRLRVIKP